MAAKVTAGLRGQLLQKPSCHGSQSDSWVAGAAVAAAELPWQLGVKVTAGWARVQFRGKAAFSAVNSEPQIMPQRREATMWDGRELRLGFPDLT
eukprot:363331-Chlamydomonas_euryale.AAC.6